MLAWMLALDLASAPVPACTPAMVEPALQKAAAAAQSKDSGAAEAAIERASACPVKDGPTYAAHVLRATIAVGEQDWATTRAMLAGLHLHPESGLGAKAAFLQLRLDQAAGDAKGFTAHRDAMLTADETNLLAVGGIKRESFRVAGGTVAAYEAALIDGSFRRAYEFVATPDDPAAYPATIQLTDDQGAIGLQKALAKPGAPTPAHVWFIDLYTCNRQSTLAPPKDPLGERPGYDEIRARVVAAFADPTLLAAVPPPEKSECQAGRWILPGFGQPRRPG